MARNSNGKQLAQALKSHADDVLEEWIGQLNAGPGRGSSRIAKATLRGECQQFLDALLEAISAGNLGNVEAPQYELVRDFLDELSKGRAAVGSTPSETATFIFSLKQPLFTQINRLADADAGKVAELHWEVTQLLDGLGLRTVEAFQRGREEIIRRQQEELAELSTPVVRLWRGILALPLIGTLDSARTQVVMENLLQSIIDFNSDIAIIDITGVPTVDTLVAQHLLKTVAAARLMGADCIISGIRPQIAQTMVHLGVELDVVTKPSMADAFAVALERTGQKVVRAGE